MVYVQRCAKGIFLEDNRLTVFVFSNFNKKIQVSMAPTQKRHMVEACRKAEHRISNVKEGAQLLHFMNREGLPKHTMVLSPPSRSIAQAIISKQQKGMTGSEL